MKKIKQILKIGEGNEDEIGMEMKVKMESEEWKMRMKL